MNKNRMKPWGVGFVLLFLVKNVVLSQSCVEVWNYWSDYVRHEVNLDSGSVISRQIPEAATGYQGEDSPNGRYNARMEPREQGSIRYHLLLTDRDRGISITLADGVSGLEWSPDGTWLAYMQSREDRSLGGLALYNMETGQRIVSSLPENRWDMLGIDWSPDGTWIAATFIVDSVFLGSDVLLYSVPDLALVKTFKTRVSSAKVLWSPDATTITAYGTNDVFAMMDVVSERVFHVSLDGAGYYEAEWSPGGGYLLIRHSFGDLAEMMDILSARGEVRAKNRYITSGLWVNDHQALVRTWESSGLDNLTLFDVASGDQRVIQAQVELSAPSPDGRYVAASDSLEQNSLRVFDLTAGEPPKKIDTDARINSLIWREDGSGLIALFEDRSLRGYDLERQHWRIIAAVPGHEWMLRRVGCAS
jgi:WD40 repeat protein